MAVSPRERIPAIDTAKGLGILCVFLGHLCVVDSVPFRMIFNFHMPLFFVLAGIVFDLDRLGDFRTLMRKLGRNILRPFVFFVLLGALINIIRGTFLPQPGTNNVFLWILEITKGQPTFVPSACLLFPLTLYASSLFPTPNIAIPTAPVWWCFLPCSIIGALSILSISQWFSFRPLTFIGKNSLIFFMLEGHIVPVILLATHKIFPNSSLSPMSTQLSPILIPLVLFASLACISCLVPTINRLFLRRQ